MIICCNNCRTDILILFQHLDSNILRSYVSRQEGVFLGLLVSNVGFLYLLFNRSLLVHIVMKLIVFKLVIEVVASLMHMRAVGNTLF